jgi:hypothetical protein
MSRFLRICLTAVWLLECLSIPLGAQVLTTASRIAWEAPTNAASVAEALALQYRAYVDGASGFTALTGVTCTPPVAPAVVASCAGPVPAALLPILNAAGIHNLTLSAFSGAAMLEGAQSIPFVLRMAPTAPTTLRVTP